MVHDIDKAFFGLPAPGRWFISGVDADQTGLSHPPTHQERDRIAVMHLDDAGIKCLLRGIRLINAKRA
jgi:hypothetical protein